MISAKAVQYVETYADMADKHSARIMRDMLRRDLDEQRRVSETCSDPKLRAEFDGIFAEDVTRAEAALKKMEEVLEKEELK